MEKRKQMYEVKVKIIISIRNGNIRADRKM